MDRNIQIENRIRKIIEHDTLHKINSYGWIAMDCASENEKKLRLEELQYMRKHPEIFRKSPPNDNSTCLIKLH